jgi:hypothetical protein
VSLAMFFFLCVQLLTRSFSKKIKIQKIRKIKLYKETRCEKKEVEGPNCFWVLGHQAIKNNKKNFHL